MPLNKETKPKPWASSSIFLLCGLFPNCSLIQFKESEYLGKLTTQAFIPLIITIFIVLFFIFSSLFIDWLIYTNRAEERWNTQNFPDKD